MRTRLFNLRDRIAGSFWFLPSALIVMATGLGVLLPMADEADILQLHWLYETAATPEGVRSVLSVIAGGMITVAGVVFSVTMVTLSIASSQFGSRVLRNRMRDRATQLALGAFLGTSIYCFLVLSSVRGTDGSTFVPQLSVTVGILMALASLFVLIYFIHDVAEAVQAPHIAARLARELNTSIDRLFPEKVGTVEDGESMNDEPIDRAIQADLAWTIPSRHEGYVQGVDGEPLVDLARRHQLIVHLLVRPGAFVMYGDPIARVLQDVAEKAKITEAINETFLVGETRTPRQDVNCTVLELAQLTVRALSPGINDPFTAMNGIDRLSAALCRLAQRKLPSRYRRDEEGNLRVIADSVTFGEMLAAAFNQIRQNAGSAPPVGIRLLEGLTSMARKCRREADRQAIFQQARLILEVYQKSDQLADDLHGIEEQFQQVENAIQESRRQRSETTRTRHTRNQDEHLPDTRKSGNHTEAGALQLPAGGDVNG